jgi:hypothetical protein
MALKRPPIHQVDAPGIYIDEDDSAWLDDQIQAELDAMEAAGEDPSTHPVLRYRSGDTRYDLNAMSTSGKCPLDYLDETKKPVKFELRRLPPREYMALVSRIGREGAAVVAFDAAAQGIVKVEGMPWSTNRKELDRLFDAEDAEGCIPARIGAAVISYSSPLSDSEKKA